MSISAGTPPKVIEQQPETLSRRPFVSVIIPTFEDPQLGRCLEALAAQSYPGHRYEIIVVNNADTRLPITAELAGVAVHHEATPGSYAARNRGIQVARGEVLAFTDSDCIPDRDWLSAAVERMNRDDSPDMVGGDVRIFPKRKDKLTAAELFETVWGFPQQQFVENKHYAATANLFAYKRVFREVGFFNPRMLSGGDMEWGGRAHQSGYRIAFSREAFVSHPARYSVAELAEKYVRTCGGHYQLRRLRNQGHRGTVIKLIRRPFRSLFKKNVLESPLQRVRYAGVQLLLSTLQLGELLRLGVGGKPRRR